jgi:hypothetical protein
MEEANVPPVVAAKASMAAAVVLERFMSGNES